MIPEGYLTVVAGQPDFQDNTSSGTLWYSPDIGGEWPQWTGSSWNASSFLSGPTDQVGPSLNLSSVPLGQYHIFASAAGLVLGSSWGAADPQSLLTRLDGKLVDPSTNNPWLGSINIRSPGQLTCQTGHGTARHWDLYNPYNQRDIALRVVPNQANYCPTNQYPAFRPFRGELDGDVQASIDSSATVFTGKRETFKVIYTQICWLNLIAGAYGLVFAIGWNGGYCGSWVIFSNDAASQVLGGYTGAAQHIQPRALGVNTLTMMVAAAVNSSNRAAAIWGSGPAYIPNDELNSYMTVCYRG